MMDSHRSFGPQPLYSTKSSWKINKASDTRKCNRGRTGAKARTWTGDEERILLECRDKRIQYKKIAVRLQKSELACRLHYHQLSKHRPSIEIEDFDDDGTEVMNARGRSAYSPSCSSAISITPPTEHRGLKHCRLPSFTSLLDDHHHRRSLSVPSALSWEQQFLYPPANPAPYVLPPPPPLPAPPGLLSPFLERPMGHRRTSSGYFQSASSIMPTPSGCSYQGVRPRESPMFHASTQLLTPPSTESKLTPPPSSASSIGRCSVGAILNYGGFTK